MLDHMGWWMFDAETQTLINRVSDQRIRFESLVDGTRGSLLRSPASGPARLRFCPSPRVRPDARRGG